MSDDPVTPEPVPEPEPDPEPEPVPGKPGDPGYPASQDKPREGERGKGEVAERTDNRPGHLPRESTETGEQGEHEAE